MILQELIKENQDSFIKKVKEIADDLKIPAEWLMLVMWFETARTLDHRKVNFQRGDSPVDSLRCKFRATGLLQFMPSTARAMGTTNMDLYAMSNVRQLDYVHKYLAVYKGKYQSFLDLYLAVFYPAAIGKPDTYVIASDTIARQNPIFDINKDLDITKAEIRKALYSTIPSQYQKYAS